MKKNLITGLVLASFALICALCLSLVNLLTEGRIKEQEEKNINAAISEVCPFDKNIYTLSIKEDEYSDDVVDKDDVLTYIVKNTETNEIYACIYQVTKKGFANDITLMIAINNNHEVMGYKVVSANETKGDITTHDFNMNNKNNLDTFTKLSGSSISSNAVYKCFNTALYLSHIDMK